MHKIIYKCQKMCYFDTRFWLTKMKSKVGKRMGTCLLWVIIIGLIVYFLRTIALFIVENRIIMAICLVFFSIIAYFLRRKRDGFPKRRFWNAFKIGRARGMEWDEEWQEQETKHTTSIVPSVYPDRFDSDYANPDTRKGIKFSGSKFDIPEVKLCAAILLSGNQNGSKIRNNNEYSLYFEGRYGIVNIGTLHKWLYEQGYLRKAVLSEALSLYKMPELKTILESMGQKKGGNKDALIERIVANIDNEDKERILIQCEHLFPTKKGYEFLWENEDYVMYHKKSYGLTFDEFNKHRISRGRKRKFYDTVFQALNEQALTFQLSKQFSRLWIVYTSLSDSLHDEGRYDLSLQNALYGLYLSANLSWYSDYFEEERIEIDSIQRVKNWVKSCDNAFHDINLKRVVELKEYYHEQMLDVIYSCPILPYTIFDRSDLARVVNDLLNEVYFNKEYYTNYVCAKYEKYIKQFL